MKKLETEKIKPTFTTSTFKTDTIKVGLVFSISNFFIAKTSLANNWRRKKIPSCSYSALVKLFFKVSNSVLPEQEIQEIVVGMVQIFLSVIVWYCCKQEPILLSNLSCFKATAVFISILKFRFSR